MTNIQSRKKCKVIPLPIYQHNNNQQEHKRIFGIVRCDNGGAARRRGAAFKRARGGASSARGVGADAAVVPVRGGGGLVGLVVASRLALGGTCAVCCL